MTELLTIDEAADYLTVSRRTVYREVQRKRLVTLRVRGSTRIRRSDLDRYLRDAERTSAA